MVKNDRLNFSFWYRKNVDDLHTEFLLEKRGLDLGGCKVHMPKDVYYSARNYAFEKYLLENT